MHTSAGDSWIFTGKSGSVSCRVTAPRSWCTQGFIVPSKSLFPWGFSVLLLDLQVGKSVVGPRTFATVWEILYYNCSPVCGSSAWQLYGGANGNLLQEDLCHTPCLPGSPCPCGRSLLTHTSRGDTQTLKGRSGLISYEGHCSFHSVLVHTRFCLCPPSVSGGSEIWF